MNEVYHKVVKNHRPIICASQLFDGDEPSNKMMFLIEKKIKQSSGRLASVEVRWKGTEKIDSLLNILQLIKL